MAAIQRMVRCWRSTSPINFSISPRRMSGSVTPYEDGVDLFDKIALKQRVLEMRKKSLNLNRIHVEEMNKMSVDSWAALNILIKAIETTIETHQKKIQDANKKVRMYCISGTITSLVASASYVGYCVYVKP